MRSAMYSRLKHYFLQKFICEKVSWRDYSAAFLLAVFASLLVYGLEHLTIEKFSNIGGVLILAVLVSSVLLGKGPAILTALVCSFLYDWLMVPPFFGTTNSGDNIIKFSVFIVAVMFTSWIAGMARTYAIQLKRRESELMAVIAEKERYKREKEEAIVTREVEALRNAILSSVSHDLKTPLSSIIGAISSFQLYEKELSEEDKKRLIESVLGEANKLHGYLNNILEVAKLQEAHTPLRCEAVAVDDIIDLTIKRLSSVLRHHTVRIRDENGGLLVNCDERLMDIALGNLLDNAVKFSAKASAIEIAISMDDTHAFIEISDEGCGVPENEADRIFDKFYRASKSDQKNTGTGLGLWITRRIVEAHDGTIRLLRNKSKRGVSFVIALPLAIVAEEDDLREMESA